MGWWKLEIEKDKPGPRDTPTAMYPSNDDFEYIAKKVEEHYTCGNLPETDGATNETLSTHKESK